MINLKVREVYEYIYTVLADYRAYDRIQVRHQFLITVPYQAYLITAVLDI